jgi:hypothetical protein
MRRLQAGNWSMAGMLVALAIVCILAAVYFMPNGGKSTRADGKGTTTVGAALYKAKDTQCKNHLDQIRQIIYVQVETNGDDQPTYPATLDEIRGIGSMKNCPIGKEPYVYDPATGKVGCPHPGHEKY